MAEKVNTLVNAAKTKVSKAINDKREDIDIKKKGYSKEACEQLFHKLEKEEMEFAASRKRKLQLFDLAAIKKIGENTSEEKRSEIIWLPDILKIFQESKRLTDEIYKDLLSPHITEEKEWKQISGYKRKVPMNEALEACEKLVRSILPKKLRLMKGKLPNRYYASIRDEENGNRDLMENAKFFHQMITLEIDVAITFLHSAMKEGTKIMNISKFKEEREERKRKRQEETDEGTSSEDSGKEKGGKKG